ncbi:MAG: FAD-dependent oxidoreductase [Sulfurospirillum sp.]|nr:FAD-dependent oxidoreductase [Sulfurospirillum sp.]
MPLTLLGGEVIDAKSVFIATGSTPRRAGIEGEDKFFGKGVSTCATCDGFFYKDKNVAVLGGGNTALEEALHLANICSKVYLIHRRDSFRASPITVKKVRNRENIELILNTNVKEIIGDMMGVTDVIIVDKQNIEKTLNVPGIFVFVGMNVNNKILKQEDGTNLCDLDKNGNIIVDLNMKTSLKGLFAGGDIRIDAPKQVVCAAGDGAIVGIQALEYVNN